MRQITAREKAFLSIGALVAVALFVYFVLLPWLQGGESGPMSSLEEMEAKLEAFEKLEDMGQPLIALEEKMKSHSGYENISFRSGTANSVIISIINNYLSETANRSGVRNLEQLDTKVVTKSSKTTTINRKAVLASVVDRLYLQQVKSDLERINAMETEEVDSEAASVFDENADADENTEQIGEDDFDPDQLPPFAIKMLEARGISVEELKKDTELRKKLKVEFDANVQRTRENLPPPVREILEQRGISVEQFVMDPELQSKIKEEIQSGSGGDAVDNPSSDSDAPAEPADVVLENESTESEDAPENSEQADSKRITFPVVPNDLPSEVRDSLVKFMENHNGKTLLNNNIDEIINDAGFSDEKERLRIKKRLQLYSSRVREKKAEISKWFETLEVLKDSKSSQKTGKFSVKMVFKSQIQQLVDLLYNLHNSARWLKVESLRISIADRKQTLLGVELNMTATTLRDI